MLRPWILALFLLISACFASAQLVPKGNVYFGYAYNHAEVVTNDAKNFNGWDAQLEGKLIPWVGIVGDIGGTYVNHGSEYNFFFGPRVSVEVSRVRPFAQLLIGASHISVANGSASDTSFGNAVGGGLDYKILGPASLRGELDWIHTRFFSNGQNDVRFTTGFVLNF
jgi:opacity protein-like surface antigen